MKKYLSTLLMTFALLGGAAHAAQKQAELVLAGPATLVSYPLLRMIETDALGDYAERVVFRHWRNPDQMRALVVSGQAHVSAVPTNVAAMFHNRGEPVKLLNVSVWGLLWMVSADSSLKRLSDFQDRTVVIPFRNDMPDLMFRTLTDADGLAPGSIHRQYVGSAMNAMQMLLSGRIDHALLPEPAVSTLLLRNQARGQRPLYRALNLSEFWAERFPESPRVPQAGIMSTRALADRPALRRAIAKAYQEAADWCRRHVRDCAQLAHRHLPQIPAEAAEQALRATPLRGRPALDAQPDLEAFFDKLARLDKQKIGGRLPATELYRP